VTSPADPRNLLIAERATTAARLAGLESERAAMIEAARAANTDDEHDPEGATLAFEREHAAALTGQARAHLTEIDAALRRLDEGAYGICTSCGGPIGAARLAARPTAATCITCASAVN
jgi:RNA polymerase-binding protein DksA